MFNPRQPSLGKVAMTCCVPYALAHSSDDAIGVDDESTSLVDESEHGPGDAKGLVGLSLIVTQYNK